LVSEPAACPYCVQENFGVVYTPPPWRTGLGCEGSNVPWSDSQRTTTSPDSSPPSTHKRRQKSFGADSPEVTTTDQIRPDWEAKLESVRAAVARRANRRIIMRQVGDRLIPVGVTSGRVQVLSSEEAAAADGGTSGSRRSRRRHNQQNGAFEQYVGMAGQDLEELMLMEAMRLSLLDHEEHQRKEAEEKRKQEAVATATVVAGDGLAGPSTLEGRRSVVDTSSSSNVSSASSISRSGSPSIGTHTQVGAQDSLTPYQRSRRCRTPAPPPSNADPVVVDSSSAALLAVTTPSNGRERRVSQSEPESPASLQPSEARRGLLDNSMPIITLNNDSAKTRISDENNESKPSASFTNVDNPFSDPPTSQPTTSTSTSAHELGSGTLTHGHLASLPRLPSLDFEANDDSSKGHAY